MNTPQILGLATAVPEHNMTQREAADMAVEICRLDDRQQRVVKLLYRKSGVATRRTSLPHRIAVQWQEAFQQSVPGASYAGPTTSERMQYYEEFAFPLAAQAAAGAMGSAAMAAADITHLVTVSCTGFHAPGVDIQLIEHLNLPRSTQRVHVGFMGCHGTINAVRVAHGLAASDPRARVLISAVELCCLHYRFQWDPEHFLGNVLFADGAGAAVVGQSWAEDSTPRRDPLQLAATGSYLLPESRDAMSWRIGDYGFEMTLAASVPDLIGQHLRPWLTEWLARHGLALSEIGFWAVHPGGPRILTAVEESLELPESALAASRSVLEELGNMSSPTVLFVLQRILQQGGKGPGIMLGFGPGLVAEVALLR